MKISIAEFLERLEESDVLDAQALEGVRAKSGDLSADAEPFVKTLHQQGDLTAYQAKALWKDRGRKLTFGNYVVEDELGRGGMGVVLRARHRRMKRLVAVKVLPAEMTSDDEAIARFQREVEAAAQLTHPNIVAAHDADEINGQQILVMEFVDGRDLASVVKTKGPLSVEEAVDCVLQAARGLAYAHERGVIHRDIKPANLLLDAEGTVKILDMGLARFSDAAEVGTQAELTGTGTVMGTIDYMSPEQALSTKTADARSDVYSLGMTLYYLLTGTPAFGGDSLMARLLAHREQPIPNLSDSRDDVPAELQAVFEKMVAKQADDRYQTMNEAIAALETCRRADDASGLAATAPRTGDAAEGLSEVLDATDQFQADDGVAVATVPRTETGVAAEAEPSAVESPTIVAGMATETSRTVRRTAAPTRPPWTDWRVLAGAGGAAALLLGLIVFFFQTPNGTLRVEIADPEIEVSVKGTEIVLKGADPQDVSLKPGEHTLHVRRGDFEFDTETLILKKGETVIVRAELLDGQVQVVRGEKVIGSSSPGGVGLPEGTGTGKLAAAEPGANNALRFVEDSDYNGPAHVRLAEPWQPKAYTVEAFVHTEQKSANHAHVWNTVPRVILSIGPNVWSVYDSSSRKTQVFYQGEKPVGRKVHLASVHTGKELLFFIDGQLAGKVENDGHEPIDSFGFGGRQYLGTLDEIRISSVARYTKDFTPPKPSEQFVPDEHTFALYHLDEGEGDTFADSSGNENHGKLKGVKWTKSSDVKGAASTPRPATTTPLAERGLVFDGDDVVTIDSLKLDCDTPVTFEAWFSAKDKWPGYLVNVPQQGGKGTDMNLSAGNARQGWNGFLRTNETYKFFQASSGVPPRTDGEPVHVAFVRDKAELRLYVDGLLRTKTPLEPELVYPLDKRAVHLGQDCTGILRGVRITSGARYTEKRFTPEQPLTADANTLGLYHFDAGQGDVLKDASGNRHHGKITGATWVKRGESAPAGGKPVLQFDGDDVVTVESLKIDDGKPYTLETSFVWRKESSTGLYAGHANHPSKPGVSIGSVSRDGPWFVHRASTGHVADGGKFRDGERVVLAMVHNGEQMSTFVNGELFKQVDTKDVPPLPTEAPFVIGRSFVGRYDYVRLSKTARYTEDYTPPATPKPDADTIALYLFEEGSGDVLKDASGNGHHGKITGANWVKREVAARPDVTAPSRDGANHALLFNVDRKTGERHEVVVPSLKDTSKSLTLEFWTKCNKSQAHSEIAGFGDQRIATGSVPHICYRIGRGAICDGVKDRGVDEPVHLAMVRDAERDERRFYVDGRLVGRESPAGRPSERDDLRICNVDRQYEAETERGGPRYVGWIDELRVSDTPRYTDDFTPANRFEPDKHTRALYHFDEGQGDVLKDASGNGHHGKITGATWVGRDESR